MSISSPTPWDTAGDGAATARPCSRLSRPLRHRAVAGWLGARAGGRCAAAGLSARGPCELGWIAAPAWVLRRVGGIIAHRTRVVGLARLGALRGLTRPRARRPAGGAGRVAARARSRRCSISLRPGPAPRCWRRPTRAQAASWSAEGRAAVSRSPGPSRCSLPSVWPSWCWDSMAFSTAGPVRGAAAALWHPLRALEGDGGAGKHRGGARAWWIAATRSRSGWRRSAVAAATLWMRAPGEPWRPRGVRLDSLGQRGGQQRPAGRAIVYARVTSGTRGSDTVLVKVRLPVFLGALTVTAHYPRYLGSRVRAGADRWRHAAPSGRNPARNQGRGDGAAHGRRVGKRRSPGGVSTWRAADSRAASCPP